MSIQAVSSQGDEYYTPSYVVEILLPYIKNKNINTIWCPFDKDYSEYVKVFRKNGYKVIHTHIDDGQDFLTYEPDFEFDAIISNPPFSIKNEVFEKTIGYNKPWALLMSATSIQGSSFIEILSKEEQQHDIKFNQRISYNGDRPPFPSWYMTGKLLDRNEFYIYEQDPRKLYEQWVIDGGVVAKSEKEEIIKDRQVSLFD